MPYRRADDFPALGLAASICDKFGMVNRKMAATSMALGVAVMLVYILSRRKFYRLQAEANEGAAGKIRIYPWMKYDINYGYPVVLIVVFVCLAQMYFCFPVSSRRLPGGIFPFSVRSFRSAPI